MQDSLPKSGQMAVSKAFDVGAAARRKRVAEALDQYKREYSPERVEEELRTEKARVLGLCGIPEKFRRARLDIFR